MAAAPSPSAQTLCLSSWNLLASWNPEKNAMTSDQSKKSSWFHPATPDGAWSDNFAVGLACLKIKK